jgi:hypothetical protein
MKKAIIFTLIILLSLAFGIINAQSDSLKTQTGSLIKNKPGNFIYYFETGFGFNTRGMNFDMSFFAGSANGIGGGVNFMAGYVKLKDVPSDYTSLFRWFKPTNNFIAISPVLTLKFTNTKQTFRFGLEGGASFMKWNTVKIALNPNYPDPFEYKYNKTESQERTTGCYLALKADLPALQFLGCSFTMFGIINNIEPVIGFDVTITLGQVKRKN